MSVNSIELPEYLVSELEERKLPKEIIQKFVIRAIELWLRFGYSVNLQPHVGEQVEASTLPFTKDATPFIEHFLDENIEMFERLAEH